MFFLLYRRPDDGVVDDFPKIFDHFLKIQCLFTQRHANEYNLRLLEGKLSLPKPNTNY